MHQAVDTIVFGSIWFREYVARAFSQLWGNSSLVLGDSASVSRVRVVDCRRYHHGHIDAATPC